MEPILRRLRHQPLSHQLALAASGCCLIATLILVAVAARSTQSILNATLDEHARAAVANLGVRAGTDLATGDRLGLATALQFYTDQTLFSGARALDLEGNELAVAGSITPDGSPYRYAILIDGNSAGAVELYLDLTPQLAAKKTLLWGLIALALLLSTAVFAITRPMGQRLASDISDAVAQLDAISNESSISVNEVHKLRDSINSLPLDLLKSQNLSQPDNDHYRDTAILCIALKHLPGYLDTLDDARLQGYVGLLHRIAYGSAGFYGGELSVIRQFGLAIYFSGSHAIGSPVLRASSCAWLIGQAAALAEKTERLSFMPGLAVGVSELGLGDAEDIYPGLYTQATLDDLLELAKQDVDAIFLSSRAAEDEGLTSRIGIDVIDERWMALGDISSRHMDLLARQLTLLRRVVAPEEQESPQGFLPF
ncbi:MAG: hypothetical protein VW686_07435 [Luminiphilus sp.]